MTITLLAPDGVPVTAQQERQARAAGHGGGSGRQLGGRSGWRVGTPSNVLTATSTTWTLGPCAAMIDPGAGTHQGMYGWSSDANVTGGVTAADATYARKDIVYIQVNDSTSGDGSGAVNAPVLYLAGTAAASPVTPTLPVRSFLVGTINVPVAGGGSPTVTLNPARYAAAGAPLPVSSTAERDALTAYDGLQVLRLDLPGVPTETRTGSTWRTGYADTGWLTVPKMNSFTDYVDGQWTGLKYRILNGMVTVNGAVQRGTSWANGQVCAQMPVGTRPLYRVQGMNVQVDNTQGYLIINAGPVGGYSFSATYPL